MASVDAALDVPGMFFVSEQDVAAAIKQRAAVRVAACSPQWPVDLIARSTACSEEKGASVLKQAVRIMVVGTTLGDDAVEIPERELQDTVVLILRNFAGRKRYGYSAIPYENNNATTWEGDFDREAGMQCWQMISSLAQMGAARDVSLMGMSAGVHKLLVCLAVAKDCSQFHALLPSVSSVICMAGAYHPQLYRAALKTIGLCPRALLVVHHHERDSLCPWPPCERALREETAARKLQQEQLYVARLGFSKDSVLGTNPHNVYRLLTGQRPFWQLLKLGEDSLEHRQEFCNVNSIGYLHERPDQIGEIPEVSFISETHAIQMATGFIFGKMLFEQRAHQFRPRTSSEDTPPLPGAWQWLMDLAMRVRSANSPQHQTDLQQLLRCLPGTAMLKELVPRILPSCIFESLLEQLVSSKEHGPMADPVRSNENVHIEVALQVGPVVVVAVTFPDNEHGDYLHVVWKQAAHGEQARAGLRQRQCTVPLRPGSAASAPPVRLVPNMQELPQHCAQSYGEPIEGAFPVHGLHPHDLVVLLVNNPETKSQVEIGGFLIDITYKARREEGRKVQDFNYFKLMNLIMLDNEWRRLKTTLSDNVPAEQQRARVQLVMRLCSSALLLMFTLGTQIVVYSTYPSSHPWHLLHTSSSGQHHGSALRTGTSRVAVMGPIRRTEPWHGSTHAGHRCGSSC